MASKEYEEQSGNILKAIDIALEAVNKNPPKGFSEQDVEFFLQSYSRWKKQITEAEPKFQTLASLNHNRTHVFTYFNESSGTGVDLFWKKIKEQNLPYVRENRLKKILSKKKITNRQEYDYALDTMVPFKQEGLINESDFELLKQLIGQFEIKRGKKK